MEQLRTEPAERMTPAEAEEVLRRFRDEEELRQQEMEAQATNPTVADLAEGLGVPADRIAGLLAQVRRDSVPPPAHVAQPITIGEAQAVVARSNRNAWAIALAVLFGAVMFLAVISVFMFSSTTVEQPAIEAPAPIETTTPEPGEPTTIPDARAPRPTR